jgi:lipid A 3-O-deacylase
MRTAFFFPVTTLLIVLVLLLIPGKGITAEDATTTEPARYGVAVTGGNTYRGENLFYGLVTGFALFDYDKIWPHRAPEGLRFKLELSAGASTHPDARFMTSANMFALYYVRPLETSIIRPYIEGGIGVIFTDFQLKNQGLRFNFNPQIGVGTDIKVSSKKEFFVAARLHHISNAGLDDENRGINSVLLMIGYYF